RCAATRARSSRHKPDRREWWWTRRAPEKETPQEKLTFRTALRESFSGSTTGGSAFAKRTQFPCSPQGRFPVLRCFGRTHSLFSRIEKFGSKCPDFLAYPQQKGHLRGALRIFSLYFSLFAGKRRVSGQSGFAIRMCSSRNCLAET